MAATKLIAMHQNKGRSVMQCLKDRTDYAKNGEKTEDGKYISSYKCQPDFVDWEFAQSKIDYLKKRGDSPRVMSLPIRSASPLCPERLRRRKQMKLDMKPV